MQHENLNLSFLIVIFPGFPVASIAKLSDNEYSKFKSFKTFISVNAKGYSKSLQDYSKNQLTIECGNYSCLNFLPSEKIFLNNDSFPSKNVQISLEQDSYSHDLYNLKNSLQKTSKMNIRCKETMEYREADDMFCHSFPDFWDEKYLENYKCCTETRNPVFSSKECKDKETKLWGPWASWSECKDTIGPGGVEKIKKRLRFSRLENICLFIEKEIESCSKSLKLGGCMVDEVSAAVPRC